MALSALARSYSQVLFSRSELVGGLVLLATFVAPWIGLHGLVAAVTALGVAVALGLREEVTSEGLYGYNAVLAGLAAGALFAPSLLSVGIAALVGPVMVLATAGLRSTLGVPPLTVPFVLALWALVLLSGTPPPRPDGLLQTLGGLLFVPDARAGVLVALAVVLWSRQGAVLALLGLGLARGMLWATGFTPPPLFEVNLALTAVAVGGVWFVPSRSSVAVAALGALATGLVGLALGPMGERLGLPVSILPFDLTVWTVLLAMRQRAEDRAPKSVDAIPGTPEQNLSYHTTRAARFGARYAVRFRAPVLGTWVVTQADDDGPTHRAAWRHAIDLEVQGPEGLLHRGEGSVPTDWLCYRLPVVAAADGTVVKVVDGVRDNPIGQVDLDDNWGNVVVLWHAPGLYSLVAHLAPGSIEVREGQQVRQGDPLGRCGSSGRSPHPHLHFQLQGAPQIGSPTLPLELHDVVDDTAGELRSTWSPKTGDRVRNPEPEPALAEALELRAGSTQRWRSGETEAEVEVAIDVFGVPYLADGAGRLVYAARDDLLTLFAPVAPERSLLHVWRAALARVPFEPGLRWADPLPPLATVPWMARPLWEVLSMFASWRGLTVRYALTSDGTGWVVRGRSDDGTIETFARIDRRDGPVELCLTLRGHTRRLERVRPPAASASPALQGVS
ncbi:MAG: urea transporter [Alphaproteobacteria bacterium]|nr:urea transporter [Alphaproteobacteria bacterium]